MGVDGCASPGGVGPWGSRTASASASASGDADLVIRFTGWKPYSKDKTLLGEAISEAGKLAEFRGVPHENFYSKANKTSEIFCRLPNEFNTNRMFKLLKAFKTAEPTSGSQGCRIKCARFDRVQNAAFGKFKNAEGAVAALIGRSLTEDEVCER